MLQGASKCLLWQGAFSPLRGWVCKSRNLDDEDVDPVLQVTQLPSRVPSRKVYKAMDANSYLEVDADLPIIEELSDEEILRQVSASQPEVAAKADETNDDDDDAPPPVPKGWKQLSDEVDAVLEGLEEKGAVFYKAEELDRLLRQYRRALQGAQINKSTENRGRLLWTQ